MQKKRAKISVLVVIAAICAVFPASARETAAAADSVTLSAAQVADLLIDEAYRHLGTPYRYAARGPKAFDCSGFTCYVYRQLGYTLPNTSRDQAKFGRAVEGTYADMQKGDIVIFGARASRRTVGHVGIFIEMSPDGQDFTFIHAATHGGITVSHITEEYYAARFLGARRVLPDFEIEVPEPEPIDFEAVYGNVFLPVQDTLSLGTADSRLVLFGDGTWAVQNADGTLSGPGEGSALEGRIVLNPGGTWQALSESTSTVRVPSLAAGGAASPATAPKPATQTTSQSSTQSASHSSNQSGAQSTAQSTSQSAKQSAAQSSAQSATASAADLANAEYHTIKSGDTLDKISKIYGTTIDRLCELNGITRRTILHIGRRLRIR